MRREARRRERRERRRDGLHGLALRVMSRMRLSLTFRIAMHYCGQLARTFLLGALIFTVGLGAIWLILQDSLMLRLRNSAPDGEETFVADSQDLAYSASFDESGALQVYERKGVQGRRYTQLIIQDAGVEAVWVPTTMPQDTSALLRLQMSQLFQGFPRYLCFSIGGGAHSGSIRLRFDLNDCWAVWALTMAGLLLMDVLRMAYFMRHHGRLDQRVLAPIRDITDLAATLSASNLSNRINIAGTKNELKDLAMVINTMLDRIERSYNSQKQFVSDASHELRTPIAVIQGYVNMLLRWGKDDKTVLEESLGAIAQETASMKDLVENLLFLARHDKKTLMLEMETFDPCDVLQELHREAVMVTPEDQFVLSACEHTQIEADRNMVKQVMRILLDNAVKYTPKGGKVTMGAYATPEGCTLVMQDNGPGIPGDELPKIFDRFYRSDSARKAENGGHGLGLSIARIIVVAHGGKIRVRSKVGEGTNFSVMLPARQGAEPPQDATDPPKKRRRVAKIKIHRGKAA